MEKNEKKSNSFDINKLSIIKRKSLYRKTNDKKLDKEILDLKSLSSFQHVTKIKKNKEDIINNNNINDFNNSEKENISIDNSIPILNNIKNMISIKNNFKTEFRNKLQKKISFKIEIINEIALINSLLKEPKERNMEDINLISFFISGNSLIEDFLGNKRNQNDIEKLIYEISFRVKYKYIPKNKIIFSIGDPPDNFYMIIKGNVEILKPKKYTKKLNGFEYFQILMNYYKNEEFYILNKVIELNYNIFEIKKDDLTKIKLFFVKLELDEYFYSSFEIIGKDIIHIIKDCFCENEILNNIDLDKNLIINALNPNNRNQIKNLKEKIYKYIPKFFSQKIKSYIKIYDKIEIKEVILLKYIHIVNLKDNNFFGDIALDKKTDRNATVITLEDTHFCYL